MFMKYPPPTSGFHRCYDNFHGKIHELINLFHGIREIDQLIHGFSNEKFHNIMKSWGGGHFMNISWKFPWIGFREFFSYHLEANNSKVWVESIDSSSCVNWPIFLMKNVVLFQINMYFRQTSAIFNPSASFQRKNNPSVGGFPVFVSRATQISP
jgi:hypothetical protein